MMHKARISQAINDAKIINKSDYLIIIYLTMGKNALPALSSINNLP